MSNLETKEENTTESTNEKQDPSPVSYRREIKTYVLRIGRMTAAQEKAYTELSAAWCIPFEKKSLNLIDIFGNTNPIIVEIGFGMGDVTAKLAAANPDINYLGIEVHRPGVGRLLNEIKRLNLKNLYIIEHDAMEVLEYMLADNSVNGFHIFFPDPWPKKKHHKRRLVQRPRTNLLQRKLSPNGYLYFVTDWLEYAEFALEELNQTEGLKNKYDGYAEPQTWRGETKFERKGLSADRVITEIFFEKK